MASWREQLSAFFRPSVRTASQPSSQTGRAVMSLVEDENTLLVGASSWGDLPRDRMGYDRESVMQECLDAWRYNPLARRIVSLTSQYAAGGGFLAACAHLPTQSFIEAFWNQRLNQINARLAAFSDELARTGNLFLLISTDRAGMSYVRVVPSSQVEQIEARPYDVEQETRFVLKAELGQEPVSYPAYLPDQEELDGQGRLKTVMLHYAINRPAGAQWGEPDLAPVLRWLSRYNAWLEDRVRLNRFRNAFVYVVKARFASESARSARQLQLAANPPSSGSVLVTDESEEWSVLSPRLEALDASSDGLAIKKMIAAGVGIPLHFLAEPESSTRTTAEASGSPTYRHFEERQRALCWMMEDLLRVVTARAALFDPALDPDAAVHVRGADLSARDNGTLAQAGLQAAQVAEKLVAQGLIDGAEALRLVYAFMGESLPDYNEQNDIDG